MIDLVLGLASIPAVLFAVAMLAMFMFRMDVIERTFGNMDLFWAERKWWAWTPKRRPRPPDPRRGKRRKPGAKEQAEAATDAAVKAARWPYE